MRKEPTEAFLVEMRDLDASTSKPCPGCGGEIPVMAVLCEGCDYAIRSAPHVLRGLGCRGLQVAVERAVARHLPPAPTNATAAPYIAEVERPPEPITITVEFRAARYVVEHRRAEVKIYDDADPLVTLHLPKSQGALADLALVALNAYCQGKEGGVQKGRSDLQHQLRELLGFSEAIREERCHVEDTSR